MNKAPLFIAIFVIVLLGGVILWVFISPPGGLKPASLSPKASEDVSTAPAPLPSGRATRVSEGDTTKLPLVIFSEAGFSPEVIKVKEGDSGVDCLVAVFNKTSAPLTLGLGTYDSNATSPYSPVPSGGNMIIDPRFRVPEVVFHNRAKPDQKFSVVLEGLCKLD